MSSLASQIEAASRRFGSAEFADLDEVDRILVTIFGLYADMKHTGFSPYYWKSQGDQAWYAPEALRAVGSYRMADIVSRANAEFGPDGPSPSRAVRHAQLLPIDPRDMRHSDPWYALDQEVNDYEDTMYDLLRAFLRSRGRL